MCLDRNGNVVGSWEATDDAFRNLGIASRQEIGIIPIDAVYSPVIRVRYEIEETRVGQKTNYDKLTMEIWTNGSIGTWHQHPASNIQHPTHGDFSCISDGADSSCPAQ